MDNTIRSLNIKNKKKYQRIDSLFIHGIYFLIFQNDIIYIGKTTNLSSRIFQHASKIRFDCFRVISCPLNKMDDYERRLIKKFKPIYNSKFILKKYKGEWINAETILPKINKITSVYHREYYHRTKHIRKRKCYTCNERFDPNEFFMEDKKRYHIKCKKCR